MLFQGFVLPVDALVNCRNNFLCGVSSFLSLFFCFLNVYGRAYSKIKDYVYTAHPCMFSVDPLITYLFITHAMLDQVGVDVLESGFSSQESRKNLLEIYSKCK